MAPEYVWEIEAYSLTPVILNQLSTLNYSDWEGYWNAIHWRVCRKRYTSYSFNYRKNLEWWKQ